MPDLICRTCDGPVPPKLPGTPGSQSWYCTPKCRRAQVGRPSWSRSAEFTGLPISGSCRVFITDCQSCGAVFATRYTITTCSPECTETKRRDDKRKHRDKRRAVKRDAFVAPVSRRAIYERDHYRCHLCRRKVMADKPVPHPRAAVLDHVIPLAIGGTHEPANVRTACFMCNCLKGAGGGGEQLMLIG
jgi:hypothetical protein